jgi:hypothetical protein
LEIIDFLTLIFETIFESSKKLSKVRRLS